MKKPFSLSAVMPVYNEETVIAQVIVDFANVLEQFERPEFVIVDDCSTDATNSIIRSLQSQYPYLRLLKNAKNQGHGPSLLYAYREAKGDFIFHCDSDNQFYAEDFWLLWQEQQSQNFDVAIGFRGKRYDAPIRLIVTELLRVFVLLFFGYWFKDSNSPFKLHTRQAIQRIIPLIPPDAFVPSILMAITAKRLGFKIGWANVRHKPRLTGTSFIKGWKISIICVKAARELLRFKYSNKYNHE